MLDPCAFEADDEIHVARFVCADFKQYCEFQTFADVFGFFAVGHKGKLFKKGLLTLCKKLQTIEGIYIPNLSWRFLHESKGRGIN